MAQTFSSRREANNTYTVIDHTTGREFGGICWIGAQVAGNFDADVASYSNQVANNDRAELRSFMHAEITGRLVSESRA